MSTVTETKKDLVSEIRQIALCPAEYGWEEIQAVLPSDFFPYDDRISVWIHQARGRKILSFDLDHRTGHSPGRTLRQCGVNVQTVIDLMTHLQEEAWKNEYHIMCAQYGFQPNLGGSKDAQTLDSEAMQRRIDKAIENDTLPSLAEWMSDRPSEWLEKLVGWDPVK
jgi:hypothetical protein